MNENLTSVFDTYRNTIRDHLLHGTFITESGEVTPEVINCLSSLGKTLRFATLESKNPATISEELARLIMEDASE